MSNQPQRADAPTPAPSQAGIYDYMLGGEHYTEADREAAQKALAIAPESRPATIENRAFLQRAVRYVAGRGVRQYVDLGSGFPTAGPVHEVAAEIIADPRVLYVDRDPKVIEVSREIVRSPDVVTVAHDIRSPWDIIDDPQTARIIDWSRPVAVLMVAILHFLTSVMRLTPARSSRSFATTWHPAASSSCRTNRSATALARPRRPPAPGTAPDHRWCSARRRRSSDFSAALTWWSRGWLPCRNGVPTDPRPTLRP
jgi:hypothetical protein